MADILVCPICGGFDVRVHLESPPRKLFPFTVWGDGRPTLQYEDGSCVDGFRRFVPGFLMNLEVVCGACGSTRNDVYDNGVSKDVVLVKMKKEGWVKEVENVDCQ